MSDNTIHVETILAVPNLQICARVSVGSAEVEICFSFGQEMDSITPFLDVGNDLRFGGGSSELGLVRSTPPIGMDQHELNVVRHRIPTVLSVLIGRNEEHLGRIEEIPDAV